MKLNLIVNVKDHARDNNVMFTFFQKRHLTKKGNANGSESES